MSEINLKHRMKSDGQPIENAIGELYAHVDGIDSRLSKLEKQPAAPATRKAFEDTGPAPEYFVPVVDRTAGIIGGDISGEGSPRVLSRTPDIDTDPAPEYFVPVNRNASTVGDE